MYRVSKSFKFDAAHKLIKPYEGKCTNLHGHTWKVDVIVISEMLDPCGMVIDFQDFTPFKLYLDKKFDHQVINNTIKQPTAENIAHHLYEYAADLFHVEVVRVWESDATYAEYRR